MENELMERVLRNYVPKKKHGAIKEVSKDMDGYDVVLNEGWLFERNNTGFIAETVKELRYFMKEVEYFEKEEYDRIMVSLGNGPVKVKPEIIEIEDNDDYVDPIQVIVEVEEVDSEEAEEVERTYLKDLVGRFNFNPRELNENWVKGTQGWYTKNREEANWIRRIMNASEILDELNEFVDPSISSYDELIAFADRVQEERMVKLELELHTLTAVYSDHEFYDLQFDTSLGEVNLRVKAEDHPGAETDEDYFEDEKVIFRLVRDATLEDIEY